MKQKVKWIKLSDELPPKDIFVWTLRVWTPRHLGADGKSRQRVVIAKRHSDEPLVTSGSISSNCLWAYDGCHSQFNDQTVAMWALIEPIETPSAPLLADQWCKD